MRSKQDGYSLVNARLQFDSADGHWYAAAFGKNLTPALYAQNILRADPTFGALRFWRAPRTYGMQVGCRF
jgi:iron complex outermembrane receptor protein